MGPLLSGKTILITGGTSELGAAFVRQAIRHDARVSFTYFRSLEKAKELEAIGAEGFQFDLTKTASMDDFLAQFKGKHESLDCLVHNAAVTADGMLEKLSDEAWDTVLAANLKAPFYLTRGLLPLLMRNQPSKILTLVSRAGFEGLPGAANYAAAKGGLIAMTKTLARELGRRKILVNAVNPGFMRSRMTSSVPEGVIQKAADRSPLKTLADPEEAAGFLVYLCSDLVKKVTGQVFHFESRPL